MGHANMNWTAVKDRQPDCKEVLAVFMSKPDGIYNMCHYGWFMDTIYACRVIDGKFLIQSYGTQLPATHWMPHPGLPGDN